jgi:hypothetical protein
MKSGPKGLFYGLVSQLAGILPTKPPHQEDSRDIITGGRGHVQANSHYVR